MITAFSIAIVSFTFFLAGVVDAVCGGGGLLTIPVFILTGFPIHSMTGTNMCSTTVGNIANLLVFARKRQIHYHSALMALPFAVIGAFLGAKLNLIANEDVLEILMIVLVPVIDVVIFLRKDFGSNNRVETLSSARILANSILIGLVIGCYQGFYTVGAGAFYLLAFAILDRLDLIKASGNTKIIMAAGNIAAALTYALSGNVIWLVVLFATLFNIAGSLTGSYLAITRGARIIRPMFIAILAVITLRLIYEFLPV